MPPIIVSTAGSASANSFASEDEFEDYIDGRLNASAYDDASDDDRARALVEATRELNVKLWDGYRVDTTQALSWPRQWVVDPDDPNCSYFETSEIPERVRDATCELAFQFLKAGTTDVASLEATHNIAAKSIGGAIDTEYLPASQRARGIARFPRVYERIKPLLAGQGFGSSVVRG